MFVISRFNKFWVVLSFISTTLTISEYIKLAVIGISVGYIDFFFFLILKHTSCWNLFHTFVLLLFFFVETICIDFMPENICSLRWSSSSGRTCFYHSPEQTNGSKITVPKILRYRSQWYST